MVKEAHAGIYYTVIITKAWLSSEELPLDFRAVCPLILDISSGDRSGDAIGSPAWRIQMHRSFASLRMTGEIYIRIKGTRH